MQLPLTDPETPFEKLLPDLPLETAHRAREFKTVVRARRSKRPSNSCGWSSSVGFFYCGLDTPLREVAGICTALSASRTDQSVAERLRVCGPWVQAMRRRMLPLSPVGTLPAG